MSGQRKDLCMMFSGGTDTTLAAMRILESDPSVRLHLLTFCNGFCVRVQASRVHGEELRAKYGADRVVHEISYVTEIFERMRAPCWHLIKEYRSTLVFDLCCRLSFETAAIIYAVNHGIGQVFDGTNIDQGKLFLEKPAYLRVSKAYFASHGIDYSSPVYAKAGGRTGRRRALQERGFSVGPKALETVNISSCLAYQPFCLFGIHTFFFTSFLRKLPLLGRLIARHNLPVEAAIRLRLDREKIGHQIIRERTSEPAPGEAEGGISLTDRVCTTRLCGQNGIEISLPRASVVDLEAVAAAWTAEGPIVREGGYIRRKRGRMEIQLFQDGRVVVLGTKDRQKAISLYEEHIAVHNSGVSTPSAGKPAVRADN